MAHPRALVIGLDSAEPSLLRRWCDSGDLPNLPGRWVDVPALAV